MTTRHAAAVATVLAALAVGAGIAGADTFRLHVLHINDFHSRIEPITRQGNTCPAAEDAAGNCFGGVARLYSKINLLRDELQESGEHVLVLDAGDQFQGSLMYTNWRGAAEAEFMNRIGFDAMVVGNHEFDDGPEGLASFLDVVNFPVIAGNIDVEGHDGLAGRVPKSVVLHRGGARIGIVSALTVSTVDSSSPGPIIGFADEIESLRAEVARMEAQGVTMILALTHVGLPMDLRIAAQVPGLDAVIGGHSHTYMSASDPARQAPYPVWVDRAEGDVVPVVQAGAHGRYLGHLVLDFDAGGRLVTAGGDTLLLDASVPADPAIAARVAELAAPIAELRARVVARTLAPVDGDRSTCRQRECEMGNLVADAMLDRVRGQGVVMAFQNGGGLRASFAAGDVTMGDVLTVLPFQNTLSTFRITGADVLRALENGVGQVEDGAGRFPQVAGLRYTFDPALPSGARVSDVMVGDEAGGWSALDPDRTYGAVSNDYMRRGGDGYRVFAEAALDAYDFGPDLADVLADYMARIGPVVPALDGRITRR